jgi:putative ABC transport system permease protein
MIAQLVAAVGELFRRVRYLATRSREQEALRLEMAAHREMMGDPRRFGNMLRLREESHDAWGWRWLDDLGRDLRYAARTLIAAPAFTVVAVLSLALATGATTAIFSVVHAVLLRPLPFAAPDRLVQVTEIHPVGTAGAVLFNDLQEFRAQSLTIERFTGYELSTRILETKTGSERVTAVISDPDFFTLLGVAPLAGRTFSANDSPGAAVISAGLWARQFDRDAGVIGRAVAMVGNRWDASLGRSVIERRDLTIVGVMPDTFQFPYGAASVFPGALPESRTDIWIADNWRIGGRVANVTGRMKPGVSVGAALAELSAIQGRISYKPGALHPRGVRMVALSEDVLGGVAKKLWLLFGAVGLVLAAACANVANLLLSRTAGRAREVITRAALGASPRRLVKQFLVESILLALTGGVAGVLVARWTLDLLVRVGAAWIPRAHEIALDWMAFLFLVAVCLLVAVLFGLAPAILASRADAHDATRASGRATTSPAFNRLRDALVIVEVSLAFALAIGATGVIRELSRLQQTDSGMVVDRVMTLHLSPRLPDNDYFAIESRVAQLPGVQGAGFIQLIPLQHWDWLGDIHIDGRPAAERHLVELRTVTPGYFAALGIPLIRGRNLSPGDGTQEPPSLLVNETFARTHFPGEDAVGRKTDRGVIVGVVGDVRQSGLDRPVSPEIYQIVNRNAGIASDIGASLVVRTAGTPEAIVPSVRAAAREINAIVAVFNTKTMTDVVSDSLWELNLYRWLIGMFAALALVLAAIGLYGVISYGVSSRIREFAVRLALGSDPSGVARLVLGRGLRLTAAGLAVGVGVTVALLPALRHLSSMFAPDVATVAAIAVLLVAIAAAACLVPAIRVARVNPSAALRHE